MSGSTTSPSALPEQPTGRILLVEDDCDIAHVLEQVLTTGGISSERVSCLAELRSTPIKAFGLVILDLTLPDGDGVEALLEIRRTSEIPVVVLSGRAAESERVRAFDAGANDYVLKPFLPQELLARIRSHLRTARRSESETASPLKIDTGAYTVTYLEAPITLTPREFELLCYLYERQHRVCRREEILQAIWRTQFLDPGVLTEYIYRLRTRLAEAGLNDAIRTKRGIGYQLVLPAQGTS